MTEIWKDVEGYEGLYQVSNLGRVKSLGNNKSRREKILSLGKNCKGYLGVALCKYGEKKHVFVHRLVGKAFVPGWFEGAVINHIDHNPLNNVCSNLEWTTQKDNSSGEKSFAREINKKLFTNGICSKKVLQYTKNGDFIREWLSIHEIERQLGFDDGHICACCNGKLKSAYGYSWRYKEES